MSDIYIAAKYQRRFDLRELADRLTAQGHDVTAQWLWDGEEGKPIEEAAAMDVDDVRRSDVLVFVGEPQFSENRGGGRWFEFGMAHALGKRCIAVLDMAAGEGGHDHLPDGHESVFTALPDVEVVSSQDDLLDLLGSTLQVAQVGGSHYAAAYQHWDWAAETGLPYLEGCATKYLPRWRAKGGLEDLRKAVSYLQKALAVAKATGQMERLAGYRAGLDHDLRDRFLASAEVPEPEATIIAYIDSMTEESDVEFAVGMVQELIDDNAPSTGMEEPFGYQGDG